jgi:hypothetical protein
MKLIVVFDMNMELGLSLEQKVEVIYKRARAQSRLWI